MNPGQPSGVYAEVLDALHEFAFLTPHCCPSEDLIAERVGCHRRTVVRAKAWLRDHGSISWTRQRYPGSRWEHCVYTLLHGWHRPLRKTVLAWLDKRRSRANVSLNELQPLSEKSRGRNGVARSVLRPRWSREDEGKRRRSEKPVASHYEDGTSADYAAYAETRGRHEDVSPSEEEPRYTGKISLAPVPTPVLDLNGECIPF